MSNEKVDLNLLAENERVDRLIRLLNQVSKDRNKCSRLMRGKQKNRY